MGNPFRQKKETESRKPSILETVRGEALSVRKALSRRGPFLGTEMSIVETDSLRFMTILVTVGAGTRIFVGTDRMQDLELRTIRVFGSGGVLQWRES